MYYLFVYCFFRHGPKSIFIMCFKYPALDNIRWYSATSDCSAHGGLTLLQTAALMVAWRCSSADVLGVLEIGKRQTAAPLAAWRCNRRYSIRATSGWRCNSFFDIFPFTICTEESYIILLVIDQHLNCSLCQNRWHFTKKSFWLFLSITLRSGKYLKVLFVNILFNTEQLSFMSGLLNLPYSLCMNLMQCWMFDNILSCPSCNPILHSHILHLHWIPNLSSSKIRLVRWFPGSLIQIVALCNSHLHKFFFIAKHPL